jgi:beta-phosphoglucomutase-like phosphatase (HAD superfamily)
LLDFDGPVCSIFATYTAATVSSELREVLSQFGATLPDSLTEESDPLEILRWTANLAAPDLTHAVEDTLRAAEMRAVATSTPTPGAQEILSAARERGWPVAIVSNNSAPAIAAYTDAHGLTEYIALS